MTVEEKAAEYDRLIQIITTELTRQGYGTPSYQSWDDLKAKLAACEAKLPQPTPTPTPTPAVVPGTGKLLRQDLTLGSADASLDLWGGLNPCGHPEGFTAYTSGGDSAPLIDGTRNLRYIEMLVKPEWSGCGDTVRTRLHVGNNPANGNATFDNTFAAFDQGKGYAVYFSCRIDADPPDGSWNGSISQIMEVMPPLASSHPPALSFYEKEDGTLLWSWRPTGGSQGRIDTAIPNKRGEWRRFCLTQVPGYGSAGYHEFWAWDGSKWNRVVAHSGATLVAGDPTMNFLLWGIYCDRTIPGPRRLATANWQVCEWTKP